MLYIRTEKLICILTYAIATERSTITKRFRDNLDNIFEFIQQSFYLTYWLFISFFTMDIRETEEIIAFLNSNVDRKVWPESVKTKQDIKLAKRNFRAKCSKFCVVEGTLHYMHKKHGSLRVIHKSEKDQVLKACHSDPTGGHMGVNKTLQKVNTRYYWTGSVMKDVQDFIGKFMLF